MFRDADLSPDGRYRYSLLRRWNAGPRLCWVMLNPSTADAEIDDPTIRRCINFSKREKYGALVVVNLFALRATNPAELWKVSWLEARGPRNTIAVHQAMEKSAAVVFGWGATLSKKTHPRINVEQLVRDIGRGHPLCLGRTKDGSPRHPLYVRSDQPFEVYP